MTFEQMQEILKQMLEADQQMQVKHEQMLETQRQMQETQRLSQERYDQQMLEADLKMQERHDLFTIDLRETEAITRSNARAIEALANQQSVDRENARQRSQQIDNQMQQLIQIVGGFAQTTNTRLDRLES